MSVSITFLGAVGTVTGSKYLVESAGARVLVDCGLFQGYKQLRLRNWAPFAVPPSSIDQVLLTHAHIDHSGYLPRLVKSGYGGRILATGATRDLCAVLLPDSGHLQEHDAEFANRHGFSKHRPALPLYTLADGQAVMAHFDEAEFAKPVVVAGGLSARYLYAAHILGAAMIELSCAKGKFLFSGDLGRPNTVTLYDPTIVESADYLVLESTYGNRKHDRSDPCDLLSEIINRTAKRGGSIVIPSFAVGRAQQLLVYLNLLKRAGRIPDLPVYLDSPMAESASDIFARHPDDHRMSRAETDVAFAVAHYVRSVDESKALDESPETPKIIISASGMATGGRVLHHLKVYAADPRSTVLFVGYQAGGTRGAAMIAGAEKVKIHGAYVPVRAEVKVLDMLSAHADADEILAWLHHFKAPPKTTFLTHGEPDAADALRRRISEELGWSVVVPEYRDKAILYE
jgi:metallo-beta-lactamase family protein